MGELSESVIEQLVAFLTKHDFVLIWIGIIKEEISAAKLSELLHAF